MSRGTRARVLLAAAAAGLALAGCNALLGLDAVTYRGDAGTGGSDAGAGGASGDASGSGGTAGTTTFSQACSAYAQAGCGFYERCYPSTLRAAYSTFTACLEVFQAYCAPFYDLPGSNSKPADVAACATALANAPCEAAGPFVCRFPPGDVAAGGACAAAAQCAAGTCNGAGPEACGVCGPSAVVVVPNGGSCAPVTGKVVYCVTHHACIADVCRPVALEGESCGAGATCSPEAVLRLECRGGVCMRAGRAGDACDAAGTCAAGFTCERATNRCMAMPEVQPGQPCVSTSIPIARAASATAPTRPTASAAPSQAGASRASAPPCAAAWIAARRGSPARAACARAPTSARPPPAGRSRPAGQPADLANEAMKSARALAPATGMALYIDARMPPTVR